MQPKMCSKCKKNIAVVFITKVENGVTMNEGYCLKCARSLGIPQIDQAVKQMGISDEDLDMLSDEMSSMFGQKDDSDSSDDDEIDSQTATFPFLNKLFGAAGQGHAALLEKIRAVPGCEALTWDDVQLASTIFAVKPGDGSAREQAASCQRVLGAGANIVNEYATKRYRSNLINWGMLPFQLNGAAPFGLGDYILIPHVREALKGDLQNIPAYVLGEEVKPFALYMAPLTSDEREILADGCLINYYKR